MASSGDEAVARAGVYICGECTTCVYRLCVQHTLLSELGTPDCPAEHGTHTRLAGETAARRSRRARKKAADRPTDAELAAAAARTQQELLQRLVQWIHPDTLPADPADLKAEDVPDTQSVEMQILTALRIRQDLHDSKPVLPCAVCACYVGRCDVEEEGCPLAELPALPLLAADGIEKTDELPRDGITHLVHEGVKYCLSAEGVTSPAGSAQTRLRVCRTCWSSLTKKKPAVPPRSLVRVDTGPWPQDNYEGRPTDLPPLTYVERLLLSSVVPSRRIVVLRPTHSTAPCGVQKKELTGHVVVLPGTSVERVDSMLLPRDLASLPDVMTVSSMAGLLRLRRPACCGCGGRLVAAAAADLFVCSRTAPATALYTHTALPR